MEPILTFSVANQKLFRTDNFCVVSDSKTYLTAKFSFLTDDWKDTTKTAIFTHSNKPYTVLLEHDSCVIPWEVIKPSYFSVSVFGKSQQLITTQNPLVLVEKSGYADGKTPENPSPTVYEQILTQYEKKADGMEIINHELFLKSGNNNIAKVIIPIGGGGDGFENNYSLLTNKPSINSVELNGEKSLEELGIEELSNTDIEEIIKNLGGI